MNATICYFHRLLILLPLLLLTTPVLHAQQLHDRLQVDQSQLFLSDPMGDWRADWAEQSTHDTGELHITDRLLAWEEGQRALEVFHRSRELREMGIQELGVMEQETTYEEGDTRNFDIIDFEGSDFEPPYDFLQVEFTLMVMDDNSEIWVETAELEEENNNDGVTEEDVEAMRKALEEETPQRSLNPENGILENNSELFGQRPNKQGTGRVKVLLHDIRDGWTPEEGGPFITGFFNPIDLFDRGDGPNEHENSNEADILYVTNQPGEPIDRLNTLAHEDQHLIHAFYDRESGYQGLTTFQNEGQSELSEVLNGYRARNMSYLNDPREVSGTVSDDGWLYRWRRGQNDVIFDYQRAGLLHAYISERIGPYEAGRITRTEGTANPAYREVLEPNDVELASLLTHFHVANWVNNPGLGDGRYGYTLPQHSQTRARIPSDLFDAAADDHWLRSDDITVFYGGARYTRWFGVENLDLRVLDADPGVEHYVIKRQKAGGSPVIESFDSDRVFEQEYESIVLVTTFTGPDGEATEDPAEFRLAAEWDPTDLVVEELSYYTEPQVPVVALLPWADLGGETISYRISPELDGRISEVGLRIWDDDDAVQGEGDLKLRLVESQDNAPTQQVVGEQEVPLERLSGGMNIMEVDDPDWQVETGQDYHVLFDASELDEEEARIEVMFDRGGTDSDNTDYFPVRTLYYLTDVDDQPPGWFSFDDPEQDGENINVMASVHMVGRSEAGPSETLPPVSDEFELLPNYPNPFNPETTIPYSLHETADILLEIYDVMGRRIATLEEGEMRPGLHQPEFDASGLASGVYVYRLMVNGELIDARKMVRIR